MLRVTVLVVGRAIGVCPDEADFVAQLDIAEDGLVVVGGLGGQAAADESRLVIDYRARWYWRKQNKNLAVWELYDKLVAL
jgi:hypothetical protein